MRRRRSRRSNEPETRSTFRVPSLIWWGLGGGGIIAVHAVAIVDDPDSLHAPCGNLDGNLGCTRIYGVLDQFLNHARWTLNDLAGGNLI